eukprot:TRINITY_DN2118_c1_g1_i1.p1 TRINITY_DN2118_c1_g1~~TRINITY_DN2118_c1_g1_i1.p1  ORF type:complete len:753 (-),score=169.85 TRINITY_DN2118_c1_g1_i1:102-2360(-)
MFVPLLLFMVIQIIQSANVNITEITNSFNYTDTNMQFGYVVSTDSNTLVVTAPYASNTDNNSVGALYIYSRSANSSWSKKEIFFPSSGSKTGYYGSSMVFNNDTILVGDPGDFGENGTVYVYNYDGVSWSYSGRINSPSPASAEGFGASIAMSESGEWAIIGAPRRGGKGAFYAFKRSSNTWSYTQMVASTFGYNDYFGYNLQVSGDTLIVSTKLSSENGRLDVYKLNTNWVYHSTILSPISSGAVKFGYSVAFDSLSQTLIAGAPYANNRSGSVYFYRFNTTQSAWNLQYSVDGLEGYLLGFSLYLSKNYLLISSPFNGTGFVDLYVRGSSGWVKEDTYSSELDTTSALFGSSLSIYENYLVLGCPFGNGTGLVFTQIICPSDKYGPSCQYTCSCQHGLCKSGTLGDGSCFYCNGGYFGTNCNVSCQCVHGVCNNDPMLGDGLCLSCDSGYYGSKCDQPCACVHGVCDRITGTCKSCDAGYYGVNCDTPCLCVNGTCNNDPVSGDGKCMLCNANHYGLLCDQQCNPNCTTCDDGVVGTGSCTSCVARRYGSQCTECSLSCSTCDDGANGTGACTGCKPGRAGSDCSVACPVGCATCDDGLNGTGLCTSCNGRRYGNKCSICTCEQGDCDSGVNGTGRCLSCILGFYGMDCSTLCNCTISLCDSGVSGSGLCPVVTNPPTVAPPTSDPNSTPTPTPTPTPSDLSDVPFEFPPDENPSSFSSSSALFQQSTTKTMFITIIISNLILLLSSLFL